MKRGARQVASEVQRGTWNMQSSVEGFHRRYLALFLVFGSPFTRSRPAWAWSDVDSRQPGNDFIGK